MALDPKAIGPNEEQWEFFTPAYQRMRVPARAFCAYDFRDHDGELFSTVAPSLAEARRRRDSWRDGRGRA